MNFSDDDRQFLDTSSNTAMEVPAHAWPVLAKPAIAAVSSAAIPERDSPSHQALAAHARFLQEVLAEVLLVLSEGQASVERLTRALTRY